MTVTGCPAVTSGIGQAVSYYACTGTYSLDGRRYHAVIGGSRVVHPAGQKLDAVTVPGDPQLLSTAEAVAKKYSSLTPYITPIVLGGVTAVLALVVLGWPRWPRWRRRQTRTGSVVVAES